MDNKSGSYTQVMEHLKHLTKEKIWCDSTNNDSCNSTHLSKSIKELINRSTDPNKAHSVSLNINDKQSQDLLNFFQDKDYSYYLMSPKPQANKCRQMPQFITMLCGLTKLCLSFRGDNQSGDILAALSKVHELRVPEADCNSTGQAHHETR